MGATPSPPASSMACPACSRAALAVGATADHPHSLNTKGGNALNIRSAFFLSYKIILRYLFEKCLLDRAHLNRGKLQSAGASCIVQPGVFRETLKLFLIRAALLFPNEVPEMLALSVQKYHYLFVIGFVLFYFYRMSACSTIPLPVPPPATISLSSMFIGLILLILCLFIHVCFFLDSTSE